MLRIIGILGVAVALLLPACAPTTVAEKDQSPASSADFAGSWKGSWTGKNYSGELFVVLAPGENGKSLSGTMAATNAPLFGPNNVPRPINRLEIKGHDLSFTATGVSNVVNAKLTLDKTGQKLEGWGYSTTGYDYRFSLTRQ